MGDMKKITERQLAYLENIPEVPDEIKKKIERFVLCRRYPCLDAQLEANELSKELKRWAYRNLSEDILTRVRSSVFEIADRKYYGVKLKHLIEHFTENERVDGLRWILYGIKNCRVPHLLLEVLNATEIYAFHVGVWILKRERDGQREKTVSNCLLENEKNEEKKETGSFAGGLAFAEKMLFHDLICSCIEIGIRTLRKYDLWDENKIKADTESNPYDSTHSLKDRIAYACAEGAYRLKNVEKNLREELSKELLVPGHDFRVPLKKYRYMENGTWVWCSEGKIDKRRYATEIFDYFKRRWEEGRFEY
jgi:hypothetical protein